MPEPTKADIDTILRERFPHMPLLEITAMVERRTLEKEISAQTTQSLAAIEAARVELLALPEAEFKRLLSEARARQRVEAAQKVAQEKAAKEAARFYNLASAVADFDHWCRAEYWTVDEAAALLLGKEPSVVNAASLHAELAKKPGLLGLGKPLEAGAFHQAYERLRTLIARAEALSGPRTTPTEVVNWARRVQAAPLPDRLNELCPVSTHRKPSSSTTNGHQAPVMRSPQQVADNASTRWTAEALAELKAYRDQHGAKATAEQFGISTQRVRQLLPREEKVRVPVSAFTYRGK
jgi:F0F1-type ATP synthase epsilon subunit